MTLIWTHIVRDIQTYFKSLTTSIDFTLHFKTGSGTWYKLICSWHNSSHFLQWCICWKDQALLHTRAGRTDPKLHFLKPLFQVFKFELDERKIYKKKNISRPENVSRCFPLKLSVTSGLLNLPQATSKTFNIRKGWQLLAYLTFARKGCTVLFIVLKYGDDKVESYVFAKRCRHLWNIL